MDLRYSEADEAFRKEVRAWLDEAVPAYGPPPPPGDWDARRAYDTGWQRQMHDAGYAGLNWPIEYGGRGLPATKQLVFLEEYADSGAPYVGINFVGNAHAGPTLIAEGTEEQRTYHLPRILKGDTVWCQGFSEPEAGSDLASLRTRAVRSRTSRDGDHYVVHGQKIWSTRAHVADWCELLVRTDADAPKHKGITWLILDMHQPGVEVRPMKTIDGESHFCEVFLDGARVPVSDRVGEENDGWRVTNVTLRFERGTAFAQHIITLRSQLRRLVAMAVASGAADDPGFQRHVGRLDARIDALWRMTQRCVTEAEASGLPSPLGSAVKLGYSEVGQELTKLGMQLLGRRAIGAAGPDTEEARVIHDYLWSFQYTIAAGTSQIQRNLIAERILGMPRLMVLEGIRVLDYGRFIAAPWCSAILADMGADVIRVEKRDGGEDRWVQAVTDGGEGGTFLQCNRNKRSLTLDSTTAEGAEITRQLVAGADIVIANMPVVSMRASGLDYESLKAVRPDIILASATAYGEGGPDSSKVGFDGTGQVLSGAVYRQGLPDQPIRTVVPYADFGTALALTIGVLLALRHRDQTGEGQHVEGALLSTALMMSNAFLIERDLLGIEKPRMGNRGTSVAPCDLYECTDGWVLLQIAGQPMFKRWCRLVGREDLFDDPRFADDDLRWEHGDELNDLMQAWCTDRTRAEVLAALEAAKLPAAPLHSPQDVLDDPHVAAMGYLRRVEFPGASKPVPILETPVRLSATPGTIRHRAPLLGEHTDEILGELGFDDDRIQDLRLREVI